MMDAAEVLREKERLLAAQCGASRLPHLLEEEDLQSEDPEDVEHWVKVYTELVGFAHSLLELGSAKSGHDRHVLTLRAKIQELHLASWTDRLTRVRSARRSDEEESG